MHPPVMVVVEAVLTFSMVVSTRVMVRCMPAVPMPVSHSQGEKKW